ncbi:hypothetical protein ALC62_01595, partial [Cyphomyrmex costatus]
FLNPKVAAPLLSEPVFSSGQYFSRSMPMVYPAPKSHGGSYLHQRRESRGARCLEGTFATLRVLVPRSCGSTMDQHERYHRLHKDADISSFYRSSETKHPIDTLFNPNHYNLNDTLTFNIPLKEEFSFSGIEILTRIVFMWSVGAKQYHADSKSEVGELNVLRGKTKRRRRCEKEVGGKLDGGEGVRGGEVKSCLLLCGVLEERHSGARGPKKPDSGKGEGARAPAGPPWPNVRRIVSIHWRVERWGKKLRWRRTPVWKTSAAEHLSVIFDVAVKHDKKKEKILLVVCLHHFSFACLKRTPFHLMIPRRRHDFLRSNLIAAVTGCYLTVASAEPFVLARARLRSYNMLGASEEDSGRLVSRDVSHDALTRRSPDCVGILRARAFIVRGSTRGALHN